VEREVSRGHSSRWRTAAKGRTRGAEPARKGSMARRDAGKKAEKLERAGKVGGGTAEDTGSARQAATAPGEQAGEEASGLMEEVLRRENLKAAYRRVVRNQGAGGVDGRSVDDLKHQIREDWPQIREALLSGMYKPSPVRKVEILKPGGGVRMLGIPTVMDRMIQQALLQGLTPIFDPTFSDDSYGFRPGRSAHQAVQRAREHIAAGHRWVVDLGLEKFFDTVQHDVLMSRVARRVKDKRVLRVIGRYLRAGIMEGGVAPPRREGTPQGGPLSPLMSNILILIQAPSWTSQREDGMIRAQHSIYPTQEGNHALLHRPASILLWHRPSCSHTLHVRCG